LLAAFVQFISVTFKIEFHRFSNIHMPTLLLDIVVSFRPCCIYSILSNKLFYIKVILCNLLFRLRVELRFRSLHKSSVADDVHFVYENVVGAGASVFLNVKLSFRTFCQEPSSPRINNAVSFEIDLQLIFRILIFKLSVLLYIHFI
jgi:hypothetical protein